MQDVAVASVTKSNDRIMKPSGAGKLDNPERLLWIPPAMVVAALTVQPGDVLADIGAGTGYFSLPLANATGQLGKVFAVDCQAEMLGHLQSKLEDDNRCNIRIISAEAVCTGLPDGSCDLVFMAFVWHEFENRQNVLSESRRILNPRGRIAVVDWRPDVEPQPGPPLEHRISASDALSDLGMAEFYDLRHRNIGKFSWLVQGLV